MKYGHHGGEGGMHHGAHHGKSHGHAKSRHHSKQHHKGKKDPLAHSDATSHAGPHGKMPSIAHGYTGPEEYEGGTEHTYSGVCNEKHS